MFNAMGMALGLILAKQRGVADPILPAIVAGALPMPLGLVAAVLFTDRSAPTPAPRATNSTFDDQLGTATKAMRAALDASSPDPAAIIFAQRRLALLVVAASEISPAERAKLQNFAAARELLSDLLAALGPVVSPSSSAFGSTAGGVR